MFQYFSKEEAEELMKLRPNDNLKAKQLKKLKEIAYRAKDCSSKNELALVREGLLHFRDNLGPDDNTYDVVIDPTVDSKSMDLLCYVNLKMDGKFKAAEDYFPGFN